MSQSYHEEDAPIFDVQTSETERLSIEEINVKEENKRKNKIIDFGTKYIFFVVGLMFVLIILDLILQRVGVESNLINDCFSLLKYSVTIILGFMFANNDNK